MVCYNTNSIIISSGPIHPWIFPITFLVHLALSQALQSREICMMHLFIYFSIYGHNIARTLKHMLSNGFMTTMFLFPSWALEYPFTQLELIACLNNKGTSKASCAPTPSIGSVYGVHLQTSQMSTFCVLKTPYVTIMLLLQTTTLKVL